MQTFSPTRNYAASTPAPQEPEIIRMDEFMGLSDSPFHSMRSVIMLFSAFRFLSYKELEERLELKICMGIGPVEFAQDHLRESDGTAFRTASQGISKMKRNQRLQVFSILLIIRLAVIKPHWLTWVIGIPIDHSHLSRLEWPFLV